MFSQNKLVLYFESRWIYGVGTMYTSIKLKRWRKSQVTFISSCAVPYFPSYP